MEELVVKYVFDKNKRMTKEIPGLLQIMIRKKGTAKAIYVSTGIHLYAGQFTEENGFTCINHPNASLITRKAHKAFADIEAFVMSGKCETLDDVRSWLGKGSTDSHSFIQFALGVLAEKDRKYHAIKMHQWVIRKAEESGIKSFGDLTYENVCKFDALIRKTATVDESAYKRHILLRMYIDEGIKRGKLQKNPYDTFSMPKRKTKDAVFLTEEEMEKVKKYMPINDKLKAVKDLFVFQMYTGLAYIDMSFFSREYVSELDGVKVIRSNRTKTDESFISLLLPEAEIIAEKYDYKLPVISNQKYNEYLKLLAAGAGVNKKMTTHTARHSYATFLLNKGVPIESVSRALGHSNVKQTQHYARMLGKKVVDDMKRLL